MSFTSGWMDIILTYGLDNIYLIVVEWIE